MAITFDPTVVSHSNFFHEFLEVVFLWVAMESLLIDKEVLSARLA